MNNLNRRAFLLSTGLAAVALPLVAKADSDKAWETEMEAHFQRMIARFDKLTPKGKQDFVEYVNSDAPRNWFQRETGEPLSKACEELFNDLGNYFEKRLVANIKN